ncbi:ATP-dependent DNA helicase rep [Serratia fonticola]|uniref:ATP-dependent DNA helicase rep n=1 Tax=Serratia fonticola TaxID=47917 RepID=A0A4U9VV10_SERFO|nr:ATP-dependent DNA helicase rep [Serratia fonticola]
MEGIIQMVEREPVAAVRDLIRGIDYESWLFETSPSPKAAEMRMKNVNTLFGWMTEMLGRQRSGRTDDADPGWSRALRCVT